MASASVKVFGSPTSSEVARVLRCLFEKDVEFQLVRVDAYRGPSRMPQYLQLQPRGEALTFEDDNLTLSEVKPESPQKEEEMRKLFEKSKKELEKLLDIYEQRLEEAAYLAGDKFTIADLSHLPNADSLASDPRSRRMFETRKNVYRWWKDISTREKWAYVKSLQRPPSADSNAQNQQHPQSAEEHGKN